MPVYPCPECGAQLRPANPVPAGKKLRCPKCENVFAPAGKAQTKAKTAPTVETVAEEVDQYGLVQEQVTHNEDVARAAFDPIKNRFKLSARGPALVIIVKPSTALLATGCLTCIMGIAGVLFAIWPMIFKIEDVQPPDKMARFRAPQSTERRFKEPTADEYREYWMLAGASVFQFLWGAVVCAGASKMHSLDAYPLAMIASVMAFVGPFVPLGIWLMNYALNNEGENMWILPAVLMIGLPGIPVSFWCVATLRNKKVIAGFQEEKPDEY